MKNLFFVLFFSAYASALFSQQGQFKIRNDAFIQIGYSTYKALTFGQSTGTPNNGNFAIEYWNNGLNFWKPWPTGGAGNYLLFIRDNGNVGIGNGGNTTEKLWISGNLRVNSTLYLSDMRFKENIIPIQNGLNDLLQLKPYQYTFDQNFNRTSSSDSLSVNVLKEDETNYNFDNRLHFGFLAQEVKTFFPHLVTEDDKGFLAINYVEFIPLLLKALQEQNDRIMDLEKTVSLLKK